MLQYVHAVRVTATGSVLDARSAIVALSVLHDGVGAGRLTFTDGNGGETRIDLDLEATAGATSLSLAPYGVLFDGEIWVSAMTNVTAVTVFYLG